MSGKISVGERSAARGPIIRMSMANTTKVYGRFRAIRTNQIIHVLRQKGAMNIKRHPGLLLSDARTDFQRCGSVAKSLWPYPT
ncbi:hypothetical protein GALL_416830 [mine drainage metagenome]|uniref:Uncharacterized protein n=1 Tax=mine drainage metagenome TaxID=410659 RepID=A0A1J5PZX9_9ZZZZ